MRKSHFDRYALAVVVLCGFAFAASALISQLVFEHLPHLEDEYAYTFQARTLARGDLVIASPPTRRAYWQPFVIDRGGVRFGKYPPGWSLFLAGGTIAGQEWIVNALLAALTVALVFRIGDDLFGRDVGLISAGLTAFSPMALLLDSTLMGHTAALFAGCLALWAYLRLEKAIDAKTQRRKEVIEQEIGRTGEKRRGLWVWALVCGLSLGLLLANRPITGVAFALPLILRALVISPLANIFGGRPVGRPYELETATMDGGREESRPYGVIQGEVGQSADDPDGRPYGGLVGQWEESRSYRVWAWFAPHLIIAATGLLIFASVPIYNAAATGDPTANLYTFVWSYDRVGFGDCCGRTGHNLEKAFRHTREDLSLVAADLFGWQPENLNDASRAHLLNDSDYYPQIGVSWLLLPFGILIGLRRRWWIAVLWSAVIAAAYAFTMLYNNGALLTDRTYDWVWVIGAIVWTLLPILFLRDRRIAWTWILWTIAALLVGLQLTYWVGSQRYSTRYYFEGLAGIAILSAIPLGALVKTKTQRNDAMTQRRERDGEVETESPDSENFQRKDAERQRREESTDGVPTPLGNAVPTSVLKPLVYGAFCGILLWSLIHYSLPRINVLKGYNLITHDLIDQVNARRVGDQPVLVIVTGGDVRWRAYGALMASTSPFLDSPIVAAWDYSNGADATVRQQILDQFPDRQVIDMGADVNESWFIDTP